MLPALESETTKGISVVLNAIASVAGLTNEYTRIPRQAIITVFSTLTIRKAVVSPREYHADIILARNPTKTLPLSVQFLSKTATTVKCVSKLDFNGAKMAVVSSFRVAGTLIKTAGVVLAVGGILIDAYSLLSASHKLYKDKKCKVSQDISKHIEDLEKLKNGLKELNQQLAATNVKPITDY